MKRLLKYLQPIKAFFIRIVRRSFCEHEYLWIRNVYGDEIIRTGKFKRSYWKCNKCGKIKSSEHLYTDGRE